MKIRYIVTLLLLSVVIPVFGITPAEVMRKATAKLNSAPGIYASFQARSSQGSASGTIKMDGKRLYMESGEFGKQWFDGTTMWTLNPNTREVTVSNPEPSELRDANPLLYLKGYENQYRLFFSKRTENGRYLVLMNPKGKSEIKAIEIAINSRTFLPERIILRTQDDVRSTVAITRLDLGRKPAASEFTFPAAKYKDYEIVDLR